MADQLLSQADVDALVASLTKAEPPKAAPAPAPGGTASKSGAAKSAAPVVPPAAASSNKPSAFSSTASRPPSVPDLGSMTVVAGTKTGAAVNGARPAPVGMEADNDTIDALSTKVAELTKQLNYLGSALKKMELLEKKVADLEARAAKNNPVTADLKIQQLTDEMKKIVTNLKGTPGYGARQTFTCEKCDDHGHVAVQYRCTNCGHERWYGWWPEKKK